MTTEQNRLRCALHAVRATTKTPEIRTAIDGLLGDPALSGTLIRTVTAQLIGLLDSEGAERPELRDDWVTLAETAERIGDGYG